jgi:hypothetical protein
MWAVAFVVVVLVVVAVAVALVRRPRGDDVHSVKNYNHALGTLEHLSERIGPPTVRPVRVVPMGQSGGATERVVPPVPVRGTDEFPDPDAPIVFDDARPVERGRPVGAEPTVPARSDRAQRMALDSMNHRRRPGTGVMIAVAAVVVFGALAVLGSQKSHKASHATSTSTSTATHAARTHATTSTTTSKPPPTAKPTPTTLPGQFVASTTSSAGTSATYTVPHTTFQITVTGTGSCWVQVDSAATGATVWAGELSAGTVQNVQATGSTTVQFGTPTLTLEVDTIPVVLPTPLRTPFVATFTPSPTATPGSAPSASSASSTSTTVGSSTTTATTTAP